MKNPFVLRKIRPLPTVLLIMSLIVMSAACQGSKTAEPAPALSVDKAQEAFKVFFPEAGVKSVSPSTVQGVYEVVVTNRGRLGIVYMNADASYLLTGSLLEVSSGNNITTENLYNITKVDFGSISLTNSITMGADNGEEKVILFTTPNCKPCALYHEEIKKAIEINKRLTVYIKVLPVLAPGDTGNRSYEKARSVLCAKSNGEAIKRLEAALAGKDIPAPDCEGEKLKQNMALAASLRIARMPATIFDSGIKIMEPMDAETFLQELGKRSKK